MYSKLYFCLVSRGLFISLLIIVGAVIIIPLSNHYAYGQSLESNDDKSMVPEHPPDFEIPSEFSKLPPSLSSSSPPSSASNLSPPEFFSDLNFSEFSSFSDFESPSSPPLTTTDDDFESPEIYFPDVKGTYTNSDIGFQVDLPKDWKGKEIKFLNNMLFAAPTEINLEQLEEPRTLIIISGIDQKYLDLITGLTTQFPTFQEGEGGGESDLGEGKEQGLLQGNDPMNMPTPYSDTESCDEFQTSPVIINGISAEQLTADCIDGQGANIKAKSYAFATQGDSIISMAFISKSTNEYNQYLPLFEESVKTIKISNPADIATSEIYKKYKELELQSNKGTG
jgi:hypothetical protein